MCYYYSNQILFSSPSLRWTGVGSMDLEGNGPTMVGLAALSVISFPSLWHLGSPNPLCFQLGSSLSIFFFATRHISEELNRAIKSNEAKSILSVVWVKGAGWDFEVGTNLVDLIARVEIGTKPSSKQG